tara:strand:- start:1250 stop:1711 length:462 start_codon:yes stop_codon:yes gene_type:complete
MLTEDIFNNMNLLCVYDKGNFIKYNSNDNHYNIYVIKNNNDNNSYYVGLTWGYCFNRIKQHLINNTNEICADGSVYLLEQLDNKDFMRIMEKIWIRWFDKYSNCINKLKYNNEDFRCMELNNIKKSNYIKLLNDNTIEPLSIQIGRCKIKLDI